MDKELVFCMSNDLEKSFFELMSLTVAPNEMKSCTRYSWVMTHAPNFSLWKENNVLRDPLSVGKWNLYWEIHLILTWDTLTFPPLFVTRQRQSIKDCTTFEFEPDLVEMFGLLLELTSFDFWETTNKTFLKETFRWQWMKKELHKNCD